MSDHHYNGITCRCIVLYQKCFKTFLKLQYILLYQSHSYFFLLLPLVLTLELIESFSRNFTGLLRATSVLCMAICEAFLASETAVSTWSRRRANLMAKMELFFPDKAVHGCGGREMV